MEGRAYRAISIRASENGGPTLLEETFNAWAEMEQPAEILHVHYFQNSRAHFHGYQIIYSEGVRDELNHPNSPHHMAASAI